MGLPLFVAPVESDLPSKAASKNAAASPTRAGVRRLFRASLGDRAAPRSASEQDDPRPSVRIYGAIPPPRTTRDLGDGYLPWVQSPPPLDPSATESRPRSSFQENREAREALWQRTFNDRRHREHLEQMTSLLRDYRPVPGRPEAEAEIRDAEERWWPTADPRPARARRARVVAPHASRFERGPEARSLPRSSVQSHNEQVLRRHGATLVANSRAAGPRYNARHMRSIRGRGSPLARHPLGLDGLGDRERSLSPEVWDTLFSTLTPDPQPPSAGSSFASVAASQSQSTGPSSGTPMSAPDATADGPAPDAQCDESGCEHSDVDMDENEENMGFPGHIPAMLARGPLSRDPIHSNGPVSSHAPAQPRIPRDDRRHHLLSHAMSDYALASEIRANGLRSLRGDGTSENAARVTIPEISRPPARWALLLEASEGERGASEERRNREARQNRELSAGAGQTAAAGGEEDWSGMQRIVRSLARREDIPDEWWAEVGLSRTLPQEEAANE